MNLENQINMGLRTVGSCIYPSKRLNIWLGDGSVCNALAMQVLGVLVQGLGPLHTHSCKCWVGIVASNCIRSSQEVTETCGSGSKLSKQAQEGALRLSERPSLNISSVFFSLEVNLWPPHVPT